MTEAKIIANSKTPISRKSLSRDLLAIGVKQGDCLLVHSSLSALGWVCGGPVTVIEALIETLGPEGTLVMPTHTADNTDPKNWQSPPVPEDWWEDIRESMPAFDPDKTPSRLMGAIAENFRKWPGVLRSNHPVASFAALGPHAKTVTSDHPLVPFFGERSPIGELYRRDAKVLLLGVGHDSNTSLHLSEHRATFQKEYISEGSAVLANSKRVWKTYETEALDTDDFEEIGKSFESGSKLKTSQIGIAPSRLFSQRALVDYGTAWISQNRS